MKKTFKRLFSLVLVIVFAFSLVACGDIGGQGGTQGGTQDGNGGNEKEPSKNAYIDTIKSDWIDLAGGSEARDHWYCDKFYYEYKFKNDGTCEYYHTFYNFPDASQYDYVNDHLESANYNPTWNDDHSGFYTSSRYITTMNPEKALNGLDEKYYAYTITYSDKTTKHIGVPNDEQKAADLLANLGITTAIFNIAPGSNPQISNQTKVQIRCKLTCNGADMGSANTYAASLFAALKEIADDNKIYDYIDYSMEITECPQATNEYESVYFMYKFKDNKFNVMVSHDENEISVIIQIYGTLK